MTDIKVDVSTYAKNELNKTNTYQDSGIVEFLVGDIKFAMGFWSTNHPSNGSTAPYLALITWTPEGWIVVAILGAIWDNDLGMDIGSESEDLRNYAWMIGNQFTPKMKAYLQTTGGAPVSLDNWQKIRIFLNSVKVVNGEIVVSHE